MKYYNGIIKDGIIVIISGAHNTLKESKDAIDNDRAWVLNNVKRAHPWLEWVTVPIEDDKEIKPLQGCIKSNGDKPTRFKAGKRIE